MELKHAVDTPTNAVGSVAVAPASPLSPPPSLGKHHGQVRLFVTSSGRVEAHVTRRTIRDSVASRIIAAATVSHAGQSIKCTIWHA